MSAEKLEPFVPLTPEQLMPRGFLEAHHDVLHLSENHFMTAWEIALSESPDWDYHNFEHQVETTWELMKLVKYADANGVKLNALDLFYAGMFHDSRYQHDPLKFGFPTREQHSKNVLEEHSKSLNLNDYRLKRAGGLIVATTLGYPVRTKHEKAMVRGDLANVAGSFAEVFLEKSRLFWKETREHSGRQMEFIDFMKTSLFVLSTYLSEDLSLGEFDRVSDRMSVFELRAINNLRRELREISARVKEKPIEVAQSIGQVVVNLIRPDSEAA